MPSQFATALSNKLTHGVPEDVLQWGRRIIDGELQEVREVLAEVIREHDDPMSDYGCTTHTTERARALYDRLSTGDTNNAIEG